jgi:hypothetical protein
LVPWKRKIKLREAESAFLVPWKRKNLNSRGRKCFFGTLKKENHASLYLKMLLCLLIM